MKHFLIIVMSFITPYLSASILEEAKAHYAKDHGQYCTSLQPSIRWVRNLKSLRNGISDCADESAVIGFAQNPYLSGFDHRDAIDPTSEWVQANYKGLLSSYPQFSEAILQLEDSTANYPTVKAEYEGKIITNTLFFVTNSIFECLSQVKPNVVCEIGGGYGSPAYIWLTNKIHNPSVYIDIDYQESLFFAEVYLKSSLPNAHFVYIDSIEQAQSIDLELENEKQTIILCPLQYAEFIMSLPIDLVANIGSLHEMNEFAVDFWMNWIEKSKTPYFYSCNYFCQTIHNLSQSTNLYVPRLSSDWELVGKKLEYEMPIFILHTGCPYASLLAKRTTMNEAMKKKAKDLYWDSISSQTIFSKKTFLEALDIIRITHEKEIAMDVLLHVTKHGVTYVDQDESLPEESSSYIPKEALYLARWLIPKFESSPFEISKLKEVLRLEKELTVIYDTAPRGTQ